MKAVVHSQYGNPEVLQVKTLERPVPQKNELLIRGRLPASTTASGTS